MKVLQTGWAKGVQFPDIAVTFTPGGAPRLELFHGALAIAQELQHSTLAPQHDPC